jgi:hypothetical protein
LGTVAETVVMMWLFASTWDRWRLAFKIVTPFLHAAFSAAQIHGSLVFWRMYCRQKRFQVDGDVEARESNTKGEGEDSLNRQSESQGGRSVEGEGDFGLITVKSEVPLVDAVERSY